MKVYELGKDACWFLPIITAMMVKSWYWVVYLPSEANEGCQGVFLVK
jgi:hypothetical protein